MKQLSLTGMKKQKVPDIIKISEHSLMNWCISYLSLKGHFVQRINSGKIPIFTNGKISRMVMLAEKGTPDIIGYHRNTGQFIGIEVKVKPNKPEPAQQMFIDNLKRCGGIAAIVYTQEEMMAVPGL